MLPDAVPSVPPYAALSQEAVQCIAQASSHYQVPELLIHAVIRREGGRNGSVSRNKNGTDDLGLSQINTLWLPELARFQITASHLVRDACVNVTVSAYILKRYQVQKNGDWVKAIISYNIGPNNWTEPRYATGVAYARDVVKYWGELQHWVDTYNPAAPSANPGEKLKALAPVAPAPLQFERGVRP